MFQTLNDPAKLSERHQKMSLEPPINIIPQPVIQTSRNQEVMSRQTQVDQGGKGNL